MTDILEKMPTNDEKLLLTAMIIDLKTSTDELKQTATKDEKSQLETIIRDLQTAATNLKHMVREDKELLLKTIIFNMQITANDIKRTATDALKPLKAISKSALFEDPELSHHMANEIQSVTRLQRIVGNMQMQVEQIKEEYNL
ncbi:MAG: hypothetical protein LBG04_02805 [Holosporaceae bacterium]|jgi:hypothetical protein|nr:hypothetical protein [Holosporaceae bacterium]